jgi:hypothetical protein
MSNTLNDLLKIDSDITPEADATSGNGAPAVLESGVYDMELELAYLDRSKGGAMALKCHFTGAPPNMDAYVRNTFWITSGDAKGNKNYYVDRNGQKRLLPGMAQANAMANILAGKNLSDCTAQEKTIPLWSFEASKEIPTKVVVFTELLRKPLKVGILKKIENKRIQSNGSWVPGPEKREFNEVDRVFSEDGFTANEIESKAKDPKAIETWKRRFQGNTVNKFDSTVQAPKDESEGIFSASSSTRDADKDDIPF